MIPPLNQQTNTAEIEKLISAGMSMGQPRSLPGFKPYAVIPAGYSPLMLEEESLPPLPKEVHQEIEMTQLDSFIRYVNERKTTKTRIFWHTSEKGACYLAVIDYHDGAKPERLAHRVSYRCPHSDEWLIWCGSNEKAFTQEAFAKFIEENTPDITAPDSAVLLEMALNFEAKTNVDFSSEIVRQSGNRVLKYVETTEAAVRGSTGTIKVPNEIEITIPVFDNGTRYKLQARLNYRAGSGKLSIHYALIRPRVAIKIAVESTTATIAEKTGITPFSGTIVIPPPLKAETTVRK